MAKQSLAERARAKMNQKAKEAKESKGNPLEWSPPIGTSRIRIIPPKDENAFFYATHSFHFVPKSLSDIGSDSKIEGNYLWTRKFYDVQSGGKTFNKKDPFDEAVSEWYDVSRKTKDKEMHTLAGTLKRKRNYFFNVIVITKDEESGETSFEYRILVDRTNEGKLARIICKKMGVPFFRDIEDKWVEEGSDKFDEDDVFYDLIDMDEGHDFKIIKKSTGSKNWDISYDDSVVVAKPRSMTDEERELAEQAVDLATYIKYEENYDVVKKTLDNLVNDEEADEDEKADEEDEDEDEIPSKPAKTSKPSKPVVEDDEDEEDEEEVKPAKKPAGKKTDAYSKPSKTQVSKDELDDMLDELDEDEEDED